MTVNITIIGLGKIGGSIGLALAEHGQLLTRLGHNRSVDASRAAMKAGAIDRYEINLPNSVVNADLVILALPFDQIRETLEIIAPCLKEGVVVMDTAPLKQPILDWVNELLPQGRHYVGLTPVLNPKYLYESGSGFAHAQSDLFHNAVLGIVASQNTPGEAVKLGFDLVNLLKATPYFSDPVEMDGLMTAVHLLPQWLAVSFVNITANKPGWKDARKLAGHPYALVAEGAGLDTPEALALMAKSNQPNSIRLIDSLVNGLIKLKQDILAADQTSLISAFTMAKKDETLWRQEREGFQWADERMTSGIEAPTVGEALGRFIGFGLKRPKKQL